MNGVDITHATHQEGVMALIAPANEIVLHVQHDPQPPGLIEVSITKLDKKEKIGISIKGGSGEKSANPIDPTDEGIFITKVCEYACTCLASSNLHTQYL